MTKEGTTINAPGGCGCEGWETRTSNRWRGFPSARGRILARRCSVPRCFVSCAVPVPAVEVCLFLLLEAAPTVDLCLRSLAALLAAWSLADRDRKTRGLRGPEVLG